MPTGNSASCEAVFSISPDSLEELFRISRSSYDVWKNHLTTAMPPLELDARTLGKMAPSETILSLFHIFSTSPTRYVLLPQKLGGKRKCEEYFCQPLAFVAYPDYRAGPSIHPPDAVIAERTGTSEELCFAFIAVLKALGCPCEPSIVSLEDDGKHRYCALLSIDGRHIFVDIVNGVLAQPGDGFMEAVYGRPGMLGSLLSKFGLGRGNVRADTAISDLYRAARPSFGQVKFSSIFRGDASIAFFWHYQGARRLASPLLGEDLMKLASENPGAISRLKAASGADFSQVENALSCALNMVSSVPEENAEQILPAAEDARKALAALKN